MNNSHRNRIQSLNSRLDSQQRNSFQVQKIPPEKLEVVIQPKVSQPTNIDSCLRPIQTNIKRPTADIKKEARKLQSTKPTYKLVEDKDVPTIIKDYKRRVQYKKLDFLGSVNPFLFICKPGTYKCYRVLLVECIVLLLWIINIMQQK